jgi:hypothetical protein
MPKKSNIEKIIAIFDHVSADEAQFLASMARALARKKTGPFRTHSKKATAPDSLERRKPDKYKGVFPIQELSQSSAVREECDMPVPGYVGFAASGGKN